MSSLGLYIVSKSSVSIKKLSKQDSRIDKIGKEIITYDESFHLSKTDEIRLIDVRELSEYNSGHIKESELISLNDIEEWIKNNKINEKIAFICQMGVRSALACEISAAYGVIENNLFNLEGGVNEWIKAGFELE